ncbi:hypothetical protein AB0J21_33275 [Streptomyces sp. NPDC049954]|uniref:hypothetical protein n=1 Tax=Streptomyces sp. NPDC049954 TaxID=3155779 RepID=UPI00343A6BC6
MGRAEREAVAAGARLYAAARSVAADHERALGAVREALTPILDAEAGRALDAMPVARLQQATGGRVRSELLERGALRTVRQVLDGGPYRLRRLPGIGKVTADQLVAAAQRLAGEVRDGVAVSLDVDHPTPHTTALVRVLHVLVEAGPGARRTVRTAEGLVKRLGPLLEEAKPVSGWLRLRLLPAGDERRAGALAAVAEIAPSRRRRSARRPPNPSRRHPWTCCGARRTNSRPGSTSGRAPLLVVHVYELDGPTGSYAPAGIFRHTLKRPVPFEITLDMDSLAPVRSG